MHIVLCGDLYIRGGCEACLAFTSKQVEEASIQVKAALTQCETTPLQVKVVHSKSKVFMQNVAQKIFFIYWCWVV